MGYMVELNTMLGLPQGFETSRLEVGKRFTITKDRERAFPLHIVILLVDAAWNFYGYCVAHKATTHDQKTEITFEVLSLFSPDEQRIYKEKFLAAAKMTGEVE